MRCLKIAKTHNLPLRRTYAKEIKALKLVCRFAGIQKLVQKRFRKRARIEPMSGHLKSDHRLNKSYLKGFTGDKINILMAAAAFNFKKWMRLFFTPLKMVELRREIIYWMKEIRQHQRSMLSV